MSATKSRKSAFPGVIGTKGDIKQLSRIFGLNKRKSTPPLRTGVAWRKAKPNESATVCATDTASEDRESPE